MSKKRLANKKPHGRPTKLTAEVQRKVCEAILLGCTYDIAASYSGIAQRTFYEWMARGRREESQIYEDFYAAVLHAEALNAVRNLASIAKAAKAGNIHAATWMLERRHEGYSKDAEIQNIELTVDIQQSEVVTLIDEIREHALEDLITGPVIDLDEE